MTHTAFILSSGRTGTKFLAEFFSANTPGVIARHEPPPSYHLRMLSNARAAGVVSCTVMVAALRISRPALRNPRAGLYVESNPFLYGFVDALNEVVPSPTIIHIVRDPRTYVTSAINHGGSTGLKAIATAALPFWFPPVRRVQGVRARPGPVEMFAGEWALVNQLLAERGGPLPGYHLLRFEDIFDEANSGLHQICDILGQPYPGDAAPVSGQEKINVGQLKLMGGWQTWDRDHCAAVDRICGGLMRQYGYGQEPEWREKIGQNR